MKAVDVTMIREELPRYVDGLRCFRFTLHLDGGANRITEVRVPPEILKRSLWIDALRELSDYVVDDGCGGCGG